jgi:hypothetical protein
MDKELVMRKCNLLVAGELAGFAIVKDYIIRLAHGTVHANGKGCWCSILGSELPSLDGRIKSTRFNPLNAKSRESETSLIVEIIEPACAYSAYRDSLTEDKLPPNQIDLIVMSIATYMGYTAPDSRSNTGQVSFFEEEIRSSSNLLRTLGENYQRRF